MKNTLSTAAHGSRLEFRSGISCRCSEGDVYNVQLANESVEKQATTTTCGHHVDAPPAAAASVQSRERTGAPELPGELPRDASRDQGELEGGALACWRRSTSSLDQDGHGTTSSGVTRARPGGLGGDPCHDGAGELEQGAAQGSTQEVHLDGVLPRAPGHEGHRERGDGGPRGQGHESDHDEDDCRAGRLCGFRPLLQGEVPDCVDTAGGLCTVGGDHLQGSRRRGSGSSSGPPGQMDPESEAKPCRNHEGALPDQGLHVGAQGHRQGGKGRRKVRFLSPGKSRDGGDAGHEQQGEGPPNGSDGRDPGDSPGGDGRAEGRATTEDRGEGGRRGDDGLLVHHDVKEITEDLSEQRDLSASQRLSIFLKASKVQALSESKARSLEAQAWAVVPSLFQNLVSYNRPYLLECSEQESRVMHQVRAQTRQERAASHCATFNGCELATDEGIRLIMQRIDVEQPMHVWLRPVGSPFSPSQNRNQRSEEQSRVLAEKRQHAIRTYVGATCIVRHALQKGIHVTLELADRSEAWRLPVLTRLQRKYGLYQAVTKGCRVGLKDKEGIPVQKGWRILTTLRRLSEELEMPCRCPKGVIHGKCDPGSAVERNDYTEDYARRVGRVLTQELSFQETIRECQGSSLLCEGFGEGEFCNLWGSELTRESQDVPMLFAW